MSEVVLKARFARRMPDPVAGFRGCDRHIFLCAVEDVPNNIPDDPNPREQNIDKRIYREIQRNLVNLRGEPNTFHLKNKGITILADRVEDRGNDEYRIHLSRGQGIVDGGHTYELIKVSQDEIADRNKRRLPYELPITQFVKIEILTGYQESLVTEIARGLNTAVQVQQMSLANLAGRFAWIKEELGDQSYITDIAFREGDGGKFDIRDILALLDLFNITEFPSGLKHPTRAYNSKESVLNSYIKDPSPFEKLRPLLKDILYLHDLISSEARDLYNEGGAGRGGALKFVDAVSDDTSKQSKGKTEHEFIFLGERDKARLYGKHRLYGSALMPMLGAFRFMVQENSATSVISWKGGFPRVLRVWNEAAFELMEATKVTCQELGYNLNAIGKSPNHWRSLYFTVSEHERAMN